VTGRVLDGLTNVDEMGWGSFGGGEEGLDLLGLVEGMGEARGVERTSSKV
jgi:hypothetical protein